MIAAIVLAAGAGRRMGGKGKALLELDGQSFLEHAISTCRDGGCEGVWVVVRAGDPETEEAARSLGASVTINPDPERGMFSSVQIGIQTAIGPNSPGPLTGDATPVQGCLVFPVDHPRVHPDTVRTLINKLPSVGGQTFLQPTTGDRGGHPIALQNAAARKLLDQEPTLVFREALARAGLSPTRIPVPDPHVRENLNLPSDLPGSG